MRLILRFQVSDGCTYHCTEVLPVEYESAEALLVHFMDAAKSALLADGRFTFLGQEFWADTFYERVTERDERWPDMTYVQRGKLLYLECTPDVLTLDEFFERALGAGDPQAG